MQKRHACWPTCTHTLAYLWKQVFKHAHFLIWSLTVRPELRKNPTEQLWGQVWHCFERQIKLSSFIWSIPSIHVQLYRTCCFYFTSLPVVALDVQVCARRNPRLDRHERANLILLDLIISSLWMPRVASLARSLWLSLLTQLLKSFVL